MTTTATKSGQRPVLDLPRSSFEITLDIFGGLGIVAMILFIAWYWSSLPEKIPTHFSFSGVPDGWGPKITLLALPAISLVIYIGLTLLSKYPHAYNYLWPITPQNAKKQYENSRQMIVILKTEIVWLFVYIVWQTVQTALKKAKGVAPDFLWIFFVLIFGTVGYHLFKAYQAK
jgi:uncharacterized membrane protein